MKRIVWLLLTLSLPAWATINGVDSSRVVFPSFDGTRYASHPTGDYDPSPPERVVHYQATFETVFGGNTGGTAPNRGFVRSLTTAGADACTGNAATLGGVATGYKPDSAYLVRREDSETILGSTITPRTGSGFLYQLLDPALDYGSTCVNGTSTQDKPRAAFALTQPSFATAMPYDEALLVGFSIFIPDELQAEYCGTNSIDLRETMLSQTVNTQGSASTSPWYLSLATQTDDGTNTQELEFYITFYIYESSRYSGAATKYRVFLGDVSSDRGQWVDFVVRYRMNPYSTETVVNGITFEANSGVFQVWRTDPADRGGDLKLVYNLATDTAYPIGGGTVAGAAGVAAGLRDQFGLAADPSKTGMEMDFRAYKHAWGTGRGCPPYPGGSTVTNSYYAFGWDDIFIAHEGDGADCTDVTPERADCAAVP